MPLYEYECESCGRRFERIQRFSDPLLTECPTCGGPIHKLISSPAIQFKGSGFYITDYAKSGKGAEKAEKEGAGNAAKAETASTDGSKTDGAAASGSSKSETGASSASSEPPKPAAPPAKASPDKS